MTDRKQALQDLLAKVEAGEWNLLRDEPVGTQLHDWSNSFDEAYDGSLDAAKNLHDAVSLGWNFCVESNLDGYKVTLEKPINVAFIVAYSLDCPARAWLTALIEVLIEECE